MTSAACLLVARPQVDLLQSRGVGRLASVIAGAVAAALILNSSPPEVVFAIVAVVVLGAAAATVGSRWYGGSTSVTAAAGIAYTTPTRACGADQAMAG